MRDDSPYCPPPIILLPPVLRPCPSATPRKAPPGQGGLPDVVTRIRPLSQRGAPGRPALSTRVAVVKLERVRRVRQGAPQASRRCAGRKSRRLTHTDTHGQGAWRPGAPRATADGAGSARSPRRKPRQQIERLELQMRGPVRPPAFQRQADVTGGGQVETLLLTRTTEREDEGLRLCRSRGRGCTRRNRAGWPEQP